ncbi:MAG: hypothetical protein EA411_13250, partial [Saprospirales bacterium]
MNAVMVSQVEAQTAFADGNQYTTYLFVDSAQMSYYDVSGGVSSEDIFVRVYLNILRKSDGSIGYPPERLDNIKEILDNAFNPHDIYFIYDCEEHFVDDDDLFFGGTSFHEPNYWACDWYGFPHHEDGIDIYLIHSHVSEGTYPYTLRGLGEGIPGTWFITKHRDENWEDYNIESEIIVQKMGHMFGLFRTGHGSQLNPLYFDPYPDPPPYSVKFDCDVLEWVRADPHECPEHAGNGAVCGDYIPDTDRSQYLLEDCDSDYACSNPPDPQDYQRYRRSPFECTSDPAYPEFEDINGVPYDNIPFYNFMSKSEPNCLNYFTQGQVDVMRNFLLTHPTLSNVTMTAQEVDEFCPCIEDDEVVISENTTISGDETMSGTVIVETGNRLTVTGTMRMLPGTSIFVERGAVLEIRGGLLTKRCEEMWSGVQVQGNSGKIQPDYPYTNLASDDAGVVLIRENGTIEWAINAVQTRDNRISWPAFPDYYGGVVDSEDGIFQNNKWGVGFMQYDFPNKSNFFRTFFFGNPDIPSRSGVSIWRCQDINFVRCHFEDFSEHGIHGINFHSWIHHYNAFINIPQAIKSESSFPFGSELIVGSHSTQHGSNYFLDNQYSIVAGGTNFALGLQVINNDISKSANYAFSQSANAGVRIVGPSIFDVTRNSIMHQSSGVWIHNTGLYHTDVRCNSIFASHPNTGANYGIYAALENRLFEFKYNTFEMEVCGPDVKLFGSATYPNVCRRDVGRAGDPARNCYTFEGNPQIITEGQTSEFDYWVPEEPEHPCQIPTDNLSDMGSNNYSLALTNEIDEPVCGEVSVPFNLDSAYQATLEELYHLGWDFGQSDT